MALSAASTILLVSLLAAPPVQSFSPLPSHHGTNAKAIGGTSKLTAHNLNTAFEWLADERENAQAAYASLAWLDPALESADALHDDEAVEMPIYPIGATYLPDTETTHYLNNMEPRNIQMALDLDRFPSDRKQFCVVLCVQDTGRIASVGTVMSIVETEVTQQHGTHDIRKIKITCRPEEIVDILQITNPEAATWKSRICKTPEYLKAKVQYRSDDSVDSTEEHHILIQSIVDDYNAVRELYLTEGRGSQQLLPYALASLQDSLPEWSLLNMHSNFWACAEIWQTLCNTIRDYHQTMLISDENEIMVAAATAKGGPLTLPIHITDLEPTVRRRLQDMEVERQQEYCKMGMDPCLDFQVLLALPDQSEKLLFFSTMIARERRRLGMTAPVGKKREYTRTPPKRGAWFDDTAWARDDVESPEAAAEPAFNTTRTK